MRKLIFSLLLMSLAASAQARDEARWGADDLRRKLADWLQATGRDVPADLAAIGPLDPRLSLAPCDAPEIAPRGSAGQTYEIRCDGWRHVLHVGSAPRRPVAAAEPAATGTFTIVAPRADLPAGAILADKDLEERQVATHPGATALTSRAEAVGLRLTATVGPGVALTTRHVARAPAVARGESVTLIANGSGFEISVPGRAEQDGYEGDVIGVRNLRSGASLKGRIEKGKTVSVLRL